MRKFVARLPDLAILPLPKTGAKAGSSIDRDFEIVFRRNKIDAYEEAH